MAKKNLVNVLLLMLLNCQKKRGIKINKTSIHPKLLHWVYLVCAKLTWCDVPFCTTCSKEDSVQVLWALVVVANTRKNFEYNIRFFGSTYLHCLACTLLHFIQPKIKNPST